MSLTVTQEIKEVNITVEQNGVTVEINPVLLTEGGGGGGGNVDSVNGQTGTVILDTSDIGDTLDRRYITDAEKTVISNTSGTNTGDQDISGIADNATEITNIKSKTDFITVTQLVDLDSMESNITTNTNSITPNTAHRLITSGNPHNVTKSDVGLGNVDNTSDLEKPLSNATISALDGKASIIHLTITNPEIIGGQYVEEILPTVANRLYFIHGLSGYNEGMNVGTGNTMGGVRYNADGTNIAGGTAFGATGAACTFNYTPSNIRFIDFLGESLNIYLTNSTDQSYTGVIHFMLVYSYIDL